MTQKSINLGTADKGNGDPLRVAFGKVNDNFTELYTALGLIDNSLNLGAFEFTGSVMTTTDSTPVVIDQATTVTSNLSVGGDIVPQTANGGDLGSSTLPWRSLYVSNNTIFIGGVPLGIDANGNLTVNSSPVTGGGGSIGNISNGTGPTTDPNSLVSSASAAFINFASDLDGAFGLGTNDGSLVKITTDGGASSFEFTADNGAGSIKFPDLSTQTTAYNPNSIRSEGDINIEINLSDSTLRRWQFGEDGILTLPSVGKISNGAYDWTFGSTGITTFPGVINAGNINNLVVNDLDGGALTAGSQLQIGNSAGIAGAGVLIKNAVTNTLSGVTSLESGSKIQMDNGIVSLSSYTYSGLGDGSGLENQLVVEVDNNYLNNVVRIGTRSITTTEGSTTNVFQGVTISQYGELTFPDNTVQTTAWTGFSVAADDSTQRLINAGEVVKFIGAGGVTTASDAEGNITITGSGGSLGNIFAVYNNTLVSSDSDAYINFDAPNGNNILALGTNDGAIVTISTDGGYSTFEFVADTGFGSIKFPDGTIQTTAAQAFSFSVAADDSTQRLISSGELVKFIGAGGVTTASDAEGNITINYVQGDIRSEGNINIDINLSDSTLRRWQFGEDGNLTLPQGGNISEGGGFTGAIRLTPSGGANANQALLIYPTAGAPEGDHLHLTAGGGATELYLGNDYHYVKLVDGGNVEIKATTANFSATAAWTFGTDGVLASDDEFIIKAPNGIPTSVYNYSGDGGWNSPPYTNLATTTNNLGTGLTVNVSTAVGGYIDINAITINTAGTGYKTGDLIIITNENSLTGTFVVGVAGTNSWTFGTSGSLTLPIGVSIDSSVSPLYPKIIADSGKAFSVQGQGNSGSAALAWSVDPNSAGQYAAVGVTKEGGDNLAKVVLQAQSNSGDGATVKLWKFDETGAFTFPDNTVQTTAWTGTTTGAITAESFNTDQITIVGNRISTTVTNANLEIEGNGVGRVVINAIEDATTASTTRSVGYLGLPPANSSITRTLTIADSGKHTYITAAGVTLTIPAASSVAYPVGTTLTFIAGPSSTSVAIAITTDTMYLAGTGTTGTRTLAAHGMATAVKVSGTSSAGVWYINGTGLT